jgi:hypothetical protein
MPLQAFHLSILYQHLRPATLSQMLRVLTTASSPVEQSLLLARLSDAGIPCMRGAGGARAALGSGRDILVEEEDLAPRALRTLEPGQGRSYGNHGARSTVSRTNGDHLREWTGHPSVAGAREGCQPGGLTPGEWSGSPAGHRVERGYLRVRRPTASARHLRSARRKRASRQERRSDLAAAALSCPLRPWSAKHPGATAAAVVHHPRAGEQVGECPPLGEERHGAVVDDGHKHGAEQHRQA